MTNGEKQKIMEVLDNIRADRHPLEQYNHIGKRGLRRIDGYEKASGKATYTMDVQLPGMLYMRFLTSPYPHAEIKSMDTSKAEALPGVRAVLRYDDPELPPESDLGGHAPSSVPVLPRAAHFQGEEVGAAVAADSEAIAEEALRLIDVEWKHYSLMHPWQILKNIPTGIISIRVCWIFTNLETWKEVFLRRTSFLNSSQEGASIPGLVQRGLAVCSSGMESTPRSG
jgi:hypothetical protein